MLTCFRRRCVASFMRSYPCAESACLNVGCIDDLCRKTARDVLISFGAEVLKCEVCVSALSSLLLEPERAEAVGSRSVRVC